MPRRQESLIPTDRIEQAILLVRGQKVMLDRDLAKLYGVSTSALNQAVRRNVRRFPSDFMFQLSKDEFEQWKSQIVTSNPSVKMGLRKRPFAFSENGVAMLSSVLKSDRAIAVNIEIMRTFTRLRDLLANHRALAQRLDALEKRYDQQFSAVFDAIRQLITPPAKPRRSIGYHTLLDNRKG